MPATPGVARTRPDGPALLPSPFPAEYAPDLVIISAGFDAAEGDPIGGCHLTPECYAHMAAQLQLVAPTVALLEGGYNLLSTAKVRAGAGLVFGLLLLLPCCCCCRLPAAAVSWHSFGASARLQASRSCLPFLCSCARPAGHGGCAACAAGRAPASNACARAPRLRLRHGCHRAGVCLCGSV